MADETPTPEQTEQVITYTQALRSLTEAQSVYEATTTSVSNAILGKANAVKSLEGDLAAYSETLRGASEGTTDFVTTLGVAGAVLGTISLGKILAQSNPQGAMSGIFGEITGVVQSAGTAIDGIMSQMGGLFEMMQSVGGPLREEYKQIQDAFGGAFGEVDGAIESTNAQSAEAVRGVTELFEDFDQNIGNTDVSMLELFGQQSDLSDILHSMTEDNRNAFAVLSGDSAETTRSVALATKGLGLSTAEASLFIQRQIDMTGEANDDLLMQSARTIKATEGATGISSKLISSNVVDMTRDVTNFGNMTRESMAAAGAQMAAMGLDFQNLSAVVGQFQSFEGAAQAAADLNALFGINIDVTEAMMAANEGQEHMLDLVRRSMLDAGISAENLTDNMSAARTMARTYNLEVDDLQRILAADDLGGIQAILDGQTEVAEGMAETFDQEELINQFENDMARVQRTLSAETITEFRTIFTDQAARAGMAQTASEFARMAEHSERTATASTTLAAELASVPGSLAEGMLDGMVDSLAEGDDSLMGRLQNQMAETGAVFRQEVAPIAEDLGRGMGQAMSNQIDAAMQNPDSGIGRLMANFEMQQRRLTESVEGSAAGIQEATQGRFAQGPDGPVALTSSQVIESIGEGLGDMAFGSGSAVGIQMAEGVRDGLMENSDSVIDSAASIFGTLADVAVQEGVAAESPSLLGLSIVQGIIDALRSGAENIGEAVSGFFSPMADAAEETVSQAVEAVSALNNLEIPTPNAEPLNVALEGTISQLNQATQALSAAATEGGQEINMNITLALTDEGKGNLIAALERGSVTLGRGAVTQRI